MGLSKIFKRSVDRQASLIQFKKEIEKKLVPNNPRHQDFYLEKWLIARNYNVSEAVKMFNKSMEVREKYELDNILTKYAPPPVLKEFMAGNFCGQAKDGSVLKVELFGKLDMQGLMNSSTKRQLEDFKLYECERVFDKWLAAAEKSGEPVDGFTVIFDMKDVNRKWLWKPALDMYLHLIKLLEDNYPEMLTRLLVVNAPSIFPILWNLTYPLVSNDMRRKIKVLGGNYKEELLEYIAKDQLPRYLGGDLVDANGDPNCSAILGTGGIVPKEYYLANRAELQAPTEPFDEQHVYAEDLTLEEPLPWELEREIVVPNLASHKIRLKVAIPQVTIKWRLGTQSYDIGFAISRIPIDQEDAPEQEVEPMVRPDCHLQPMLKALDCPEPGFYIFILDNTYSLIRAKKVTLKIIVCAMSAAPCETPL